MTKKIVGRRAFAALPLALLAILILAVNPASAAPRSTPTPAITSWRGTPTTLSDAGGTVSFTGRFKYAGTCKLAVSPAVAGLPSTSSCTSNTYSKKVALPRNTTGSAREYTFTFSVQNKTGKTNAPNVVVGVGAAPPPISFTPTSVNFGSQGVGIGSTPINVEVTNNSATQAQDLTAFNWSGADTSDYFFSAGNCQVELSPHQFCDMSVTFHPQSGGDRTATLAVVDSSWGNGTAAPIHVSGVGVFATASISTTALNFESQGVYVATNYEPITVTNSGAVPLVVGSLGLQGGDSSDFNLLANTCGAGVIISVGDNCTFLVQFDPSASGARSSTVVLDDNTSSGVTDITVEGTGAWATSTLSTYDISFPNTDVGASSAVDVTITNTGSVALRFDESPQYSFTGDNPNDFSYVPYTSVDSTVVQCSEAGNVVDPGQSCEFQIVFQPISTGPRSATFDLFDNSNNSGTSTPGYEKITVSGNGEPPGT